MTSESLLFFKVFLVEFLHVVLSNNGQLGAALTHARTEHTTVAVFVKPVSQRVMGLCS